MAGRGRPYSGAYGEGRSGMRSGSGLYRGTKLYVGGLPEDFQCQDLFDLFSTVGQVVECTLLKGYGFIHYSAPEEAQRALVMLNNYQLKRGFAINVKPSRTKLCQTPGVYGQTMCYFCLSPTHSYKECERFKKHQERRREWARKRFQEEEAEAQNPEGAPEAKRAEMETDGEKANGEAEGAAAAEGEVKDQEKGESEKPSGRRPMRGRPFRGGGGMRSDRGRMQTRSMGMGIGRSAPTIGGHPFRSLSSTLSNALVPPAPGMGPPGGFNPQMYGPPAGGPMYPMGPGGPYGF